MDKIEFEQVVEKAESTGTRVRSTIKFPYNDQDQAVSVSRKVHEQAGIECTTDQLAVWFKQPPSSGTFRARLSTAHIFGFVESERRGSLRLTALGQRVVDPSQEKAARAESFMLVPLYQAVFEKYKGYTLPPLRALEREIIELGVSPKQAVRARQALERSATQAGYFEHGSDRLVEPAFKSSAPSTKPLHETEHKEGGNGGDGGDYHPFIQGLLQKLPEPETTWDISERAKWLQTAIQIFGLMYQDNGGEVAITYKESDEHKEVRTRTITDDD